MSASLTNIESVGPITSSAGVELLEHFLSPAVTALNDAILSLAPGKSPVLIIGEAGLCKGLIARKLHNLSTRANEEFVECAAASVTPEWFDQILSSDESTKAGTILLVEIGDLSLACQKKLVESWLDRPGATAPRLIMSTSRNLEWEVRAGTIDEIFFSRVTTVCLRVPALRHRREDIDHLIDFYLGKYSALFGSTKPVIPDSLLQLLREHGWPGNIRELEEAMKTVVAIGDPRIAALALRARLAGGNGTTTGSVSLKQLSKAASLKAEREIILGALDQSRWNRRRAAKNLGISYKALLYKLKQIGVEDQNLGSAGEAQ